MLFTNKEGELKKQKIMSVRNKLYQEKCTGNPKKGKWYARAVINDVVGLEEISQEILDNTTAKQADVYAVLKELDNVMGQHLKNGDRVVLNGFGTFKVGLKTTAAETAKDFTPQKKHCERTSQFPTRNPQDRYRPHTPQAVYTRHRGAAGGRKQNQRQDTGKALTVEQ